MMSGEDRHKGARFRTYKSGSAKRRLADEKLAKKSEELKKYSRVTHFFKGQLKQSEDSELVIKKPSVDEACSSTQMEYESKSENDLSELNISEDSHNEIKRAKCTSSASQDLNLDSCLNSDIGSWPDKLEESQIDLLVCQGPNKYQNKDDELFKSCKLQMQPDNVQRYCNMSIFKRKTANGEKVDRSWLCYSPSKGSVFCFFCKLLSDSNIALTDTGYYDWRHAQQHFIGHEQSVNHIQAV